VDVILRSFDIVTRAVAQYRLEVDKPEIIVRPAVSDIDILAQVDVHSVARRGEAAMELKVPELRGLFAWQNRLRRTIGL
jgi:hypothetical protein